MNWVRAKRHVKFVEYFGIWMGIAMLMTSTTCSSSAAQGKPDVSDQAQPPAESQKLSNLNDVLMESTFKIVGQGSSGTAFILARPFPKDVSRGAYVLVTAAHVLEAIGGDQAVLVLRKKEGASKWARVEAPLSIRREGKALWTKHPKADVAAMYVALPKGILTVALPTSLLASDADFEKLEFHPGDDLNCLGFPLGTEGNRAGFPVLRTGRIASYPLVAAPEEPTFLLDFRVFPGNSGGPVYIAQTARTNVGGNLLALGSFNYVVGLVSQQVLADEVLQGVYREVKQHSLGLAVVVRSSRIREAVDLLPPPQ